MLRIVTRGAFFATSFLIAGNSGLNSGDAIPRTPRPELIVWTTPLCPSCCAFWRDFHSDRSFREALQSHFDIRWRAGGLLCQEPLTRGSLITPAFELGGRTVSGYCGKQWLWRKLLSVDPNHAAGAEELPAQADTDTAPAIDSPPLPPLQRLPRRPVSPIATPEASRSLPETPGDEIVPTSSRPESSESRQPTDSQKPVPGGSLVRSLPLVLTGLEMAGILGGALATGGLGTVAVGLVWTAWKRRLRRRVEDSLDSKGGKGVAVNADGTAARAPFPRRLDEARELLAIRQSEGRVATLDALRGMFLDDELEKLTAAGRESEAAVAAKLKAAIDSRVDEVAPLTTTIDG